MKVEIRKTAAQAELKIFRDDGVTLRLRPPDRKFVPPHDVIHLIVEQTLGLQKGFWGTVAQGAKFPSMTVVEGRQRPRAEARSRSLIKANQTALNEAEVLVGVFQDVLLSDSNIGLKIVARRLKERGKEIEPEEIERVWSALISIRKRWRDLPTGEAIVLDWPALRT